MTEFRRSRADAVRLADILIAINRIDRYRAVIDEQDESRSELIRDAVLYNLVVIGEAVNSLSDDVTARAPEIPWRDIVGLRNFLAHEYFDIDFELIAQVINVQLHELRDVVMRLLHDLRARRDSPK